ncbi:MAG: hypothetical protein ACYDB1_13160 [Acidiferrobacteraceae bacterium]
MNTYNMNTCNMHTCNPHPRGTNRFLFVCLLGLAVGLNAPAGTSRTLTGPLVLLSLGGIALTILREAKPIRYPRLPHRID